MNQQEILRKVGGIIAELTDQYTYLKSADNDLNELELELFMANAHFLTEHIEILKKINGQAKRIALPTAAPVLPPEQLILKRQETPDDVSEQEQQIYVDDHTLEKLQDAVSIEISKQELPELPEAEISQPETILLPETMSQLEADKPSVFEDASFTIEKNVNEEKPIIEKEDAFSEPEVEPATLVQFKPENFQPEIKPETVKQESEKPKEEPVLTLNQRIAAQKGLEQAKATTLANPNKAGQDLQSLISLNDKLLFIKELFNGYNLAYSEAINILNRYTNFEQAEQFLNLNYTVKNNWKEKPLTSERFFDLLRKKFA